MEAAMENGKLMSALDKDFFNELLIFDNSEMLVSRVYPFCK